MPNKPIIIAHRGASGFRPEHTLAAYELAIEMGADFIEPDLVFTKDSQLVCRHENEISTTTNVSALPEFAERKTTKTIDGETLNGWFTEDFTLAELKSLRGKERLPPLRPQNTAYDNQYSIPTFEELLELRARKSAQTGREIGVYPETKHPSYFKSIGFEFDSALLDLCEKYGLNTKTSPIFIQSFEVENLKQLAGKTQIKLIQLMSEDGGPWDSQTGPAISYQNMAKSAGLAEIAEYAFGIGPQKSMIIPRDGEGRSLAPTNLIAMAHVAGLGVHPWTFRSENYFLPLEARVFGFRDKEYSPIAHGNFAQEYQQFIDLGVDGVFSDFASHAYLAVHGKAYSGRT
ncbi:MAG: glycerophosphoryl diester phosphodiesterase [Hyphomonadaceae bacterium]|nr:MAG: glycerophosphoryl diester phosphodiesterase [Hyphomonadaceae bacterium]KAF0186416.1 MAG: glycerophosphoryl diester phosphodiesterase [Hyphomonadaceae bacterium]